MVWLRFGIGGFGMACLGVVAMLLLGRSGGFAEPQMASLMMTVVVVASGAGLLAMTGNVPLSAPAKTPAEGTTNTTGSQVAPVPRVRLVPELPIGVQASCNSWLGGEPKLPKDVGWPSIAGLPGQFLAQIDCSELPRALWRGTGPRNGSMVFFRAAKHDGGELPVRVLHVEGPLFRCSAPDGQEPRPRWPLMLHHAGTGTDLSERRPHHEPDWSKLHNVDMTSAGYQPFDWTSAELLLCLSDSLIATCAKHWGTEITEAERAQLEQTYKGVSDIRAALEVMRAEQEFDEQARNLLLDGLAALHLPELTAQGASARPLPLLRHRRAERAYFAPFERHCRRIYAEDASRLPAAQRALFEPFWAHNARHETGCIGADDLGSPIETDAAELLLELPSSELLGWMFGEGRALRIYVAPDDLENGNLNRAWGSVAA